ncbi:D-dopachrome decarboxylase-B [Patella vulgata]|uniref:D-dopachrome decarboxylase-B n=1 Tax=Patella vulgata TaxID=6465 RepID=UPI00217FC2ED|nr:D-dopachrome decarboxylase-B [Patella vulgata]
MPMCIVNTNRKSEDIPNDFEAKLAEKVASVLNKPLSAMQVVINSGARVYRKESTAPACIMQLYSIDVFDEQRNPTYTPPLLDFLKTQLRLGENRTVVHYIPAQRYMFGQ